MDPSPIRRHRSFIGPVILICIGVFFLIANLVPSFDPWLILMRYWPVILIVIGLGKVWDYYASRRDGGSRASAPARDLALAQLPEFEFRGDEDVAAEGRPPRSDGQPGRCRAA